LHTHHVDYGVKEKLKLTVSLRFLAKVAFKKVAAHKNGKSMMNAHHKTHTEKYQHSKTAGFFEFHTSQFSFKEA
jgi:hypothetical protein